jgi:hypothetical protein
MKPHSKFSQQQEQQAASAQQTNSESVREFASPEEVLRYDAAQISVPPAVAQRLQTSLHSTSAPALSWWRKLLGR